MMSVFTTEVALILWHFTTILTPREIFSQWMEVLRVIAESDVPGHTLQVMKYSDMNYFHC